VPVRFEGRPGIGISDINLDIGPISIYPRLPVQRSALSITGTFTNQITALEHTCYSAITTVDINDGLVDIIVLDAGKATCAKKTMLNANNYTDLSTTNMISPVRAMLQLNQGCPKRNLVFSEIGQMSGADWSWTPWLLISTMTGRGTCYHQRFSPDKTDHDYYVPAGNGTIVSSYC